MLIKLSGFIEGSNTCTCVTSVLYAQSGGRSPAPGADESSDDAPPFKPVSSASSNEICSGAERALTAPPPPPPPPPPPQPESPDSASADPNSTKRTYERMRTPLGL